MGDKSIVETATFHRVTGAVWFSEFILTETEDSFFAEGETADNMICMNQQTGK